MGQIGAEILALNTNDIEHVKWVKPIEIKIPMIKIKAIVLKSFNGLARGEKIEIKAHNFKALSKAGYVEKAKEVKKEVKFIPKSKGKKPSSKK